MENKENNECKVCGTQKKLKCEIKIKNLWAQDIYINEQKAFHFGFPFPYFFQSTIAILIGTIRE